MYVWCCRQVHLCGISVCSQCFVWCIMAQPSFCMMCSTFCQSLGCSVHLLHRWVFLLSWQQFLCCIQHVFDCISTPVTVCWNFSSCSVILLLCARIEWDRYLRLLIWQFCCLFSHIAAMMASTDLNVIIASLQMAFILMDKLPDVYRIQFRREGNTCNNT